MLRLYVEAPFAVCRTFTAGWFRPTATFLTPSAAYGLLLNVAGVETRLREEDPEHDRECPASLHRRGLPAVRLALGIPALGGGANPFPQVQSVFQQLHNYPVGTTGKDHASKTHGNKYNITPVRREFLSDLRAIVCMDAPVELEEKVRRGLVGGSHEGRYGLLFLGDNQFLLNRLEETSPKPTHWYERLTQTIAQRPLPRTTRLTVCIDRADLSRTTSYLYAPTETAEPDPSDGAWTSIPQT
jgi:CRISPR-associated protein Cas5t